MPVQAGALVGAAVIFLWARAAVAVGFSSEHAAKGRETSGDGHRHLLDDNLRTLPGGGYPGHAM